MNATFVDTTLFQRSSKTGQRLLQDRTLEEVRLRRAAMSDEAIQAEDDGADLFWSIQHPADATNADLGFGPGSDDEQESYQWFLTTGRVIA